MLLNVKVLGYLTFFKLFWFKERGGGGRGRGATEATLSPVFCDSSVMNQVIGMKRWLYLIGLTTNLQISTKLRNTPI